MAIERPRGIGGDTGSLTRGDVTHNNGSDSTTVTNSALNGTNGSTLAINTDLNLGPVSKSADPGGTHKNYERYTKTYTSFSGCDIVASFNGVQIGELQGITYSVSREKAPVYTMGSPDPRSFSRGKRGIAGTLVFTVFDRDALISEFTSHEFNSTLQKFKANDNQDAYMSIDQWDAMMTSGEIDNTRTAAFNDTNDLVNPNAGYKYADELLPFDITITFANEYGQKAMITIYGVELLNEGTGYSIDTVTTEKAYTFIARSIDHMKPITNDTPADQRTLQNRSMR